MAANCWEAVGLRRQENIFAEVVSKPSCCGLVFVVVLWTAPPELACEGVRRAQVGPWQKFRGAGQSWGAAEAPMCPGGPEGPALPGASRGRGCRWPGTPQPHTHTGTDHMDVRTRRHAQSRKGAPPGPGGLAQGTPVPADRWGCQVAARWV